MLTQVRKFAFVFAVEAFFRLARRLWFVSLVNEPVQDGRPHLYAHWHGDELLLVPVFAGRGYAVMASRSRDGESMARFLTRLGYFVVRGSSSKGGAGGLKGLVDAIRQQGKSAAIAVDGPRGPVFKAKPGIFLLAQTTGLPIVPAAGASARAWKIPKAWNQGFLPKPFSRCVVCFGEPLAVPAEATEADRIALAAELESRLTALKEKARGLAEAPALLGRLATT